MQPIENLKDLRFYEILICSFDYFNKISFNSCLSFSVPNKAISLNAAYSKKEINYVNKTTNRTI